MFCYQRKYNQQVQVIENSQQLMDILQNQQLATQILNARACLEMGNEEAYQAAKRGLPLFIFSAARVEKSINKNGVEGYWRNQESTYLNGLAVLDIDHIEFPCALSTKIMEDHHELFLETCVKWKIFMIYVTPSDKGLKIVFAADPDVGNIADNQAKFSEYLGVQNDISIKDSSRGQFAVDQSNVTFINPTIVDYYNPVFDEKYGELYRKGNSAPITTKNNKSNERDKEDNECNQGNNVNEEELMYGSIPVRELAVRYSDRYGSPVEGDRHRSLIKVAGHLRYLVDNNPQKLKVALRALPWVRE